MPLANFRPDLSLTVYSVGEVNSADSAMSGSTSGLPGGVFIRNGYTWFMTANEPLSYEPAGSRVVILSLVPMVRVPPPPLLDDRVVVAAAAGGQHQGRGRNARRGDNAPTVARTGSHPLPRLQTATRGHAKMRHRGHLANGGNRSNTVSEQ